MFDALIRRAATRLPPEISHRLAIDALANDFMPLPRRRDYPRLHCRALGLSFGNPLGLAAGFDKNAEAYRGCLNAGFGFVEVGTVTPLPQSGNDKPRLFRLPEDGALINRLGFNNLGAASMRRRLPVRSELPGIVGINIGRNKDGEALADYLHLLNDLYDHAAYFTVNVSSPNTPGLRDLQRKEIFAGFVRELMAERRGIAALKRFSVPLLIKISPDLSEGELVDVVEIALLEKVDGLIVSNTTLTRAPELKSAMAVEKGGLSGAPLKPIAQDMMRRTRKLAGNALTLIGVGGIADGRDAIDRIRAGADLVQLYTALVYGGFGLIERIKADMDAILAAENIASICDLRDSAI